MAKLSSFLKATCIIACLVTCLGIDFEVIIYPVTRSSIFVMFIVGIYQYSWLWLLSTEVAETGLSSYYCSEKNLSWLFAKYYRCIFIRRVEIVLLYAADFILILSWYALNMLLGLIKPSLHSIHQILTLVLDTFYSLLKPYSVQLALFLH